MALARPAPQIEADYGVVYVFEDGLLFDALAAATGQALDRYDDDALLGQRQDRLVAKVKRAVRDELARAMPERLAARSPWHFSRALGAFVVREVRQRQGQALQRRAVREEGPGDGMPFQLVAVINGVEHYALESATSPGDAHPA